MKTYYTPEEQAEKDRLKVIKAKKKSLTSKICKQCKDGDKPMKASKILERGLSCMQQQLTYLIHNLNATLPIAELNHKETVECYRLGIADYIEGLQVNKAGRKIEDNKLQMNKLF